MPKLVFRSFKDCRKMTSNKENLRFDLQVIASWIQPGTRVLGLGCGEGELLYHLKKHKNIKETGIEIVEHRVAACIEKGLSVIQGDINEEITDYPDNRFDYVILSQTMQQVYEPMGLIKQMMRIGRKVVVSFPNFGHWGIRSQVLFKGIAPLTAQLPYQWYDTPNIRILSIRDFREFARRVNFRIIDEVAIKTDNLLRSEIIIRFLPNFRATYGIFLIAKNE
jgi:methionine biosynthesis protein MetW